MEESSPLSSSGVGGAKGLAKSGRSEAIPAASRPLSEHKASDYPRFSAGSAELDAVLGGGLVPASVVILSAVPGAGKALALDTPLPTPSGWSSMGEIRVGDRLYDERGKSCQVLAATEVMEDHEVYRVGFDDGSSILADAEHSWLTHTRESRRSALLNTRQIGLSLKHGGKLNHSIRVSAPLRGPKVESQLNPFELGLWLGSEFAGDKLSETGEGDKTFLYLMDSGELRVLGKRSEFERLDVLSRTHIPIPYLRISRRQRQKLLMGLVESEGGWRNKRKADFVCLDKRLAESVSELLLSLGFPSAPQRIGSGEWQVSFPLLACSPSWPRLSSRLTPRRRYITEVLPVDSVPVRCIQVDSPSSLFLAGRGMIPTHNSTLTNQIASHVAGSGKRVLLVAGEESGEQIRLRTERMGLQHQELIEVTSETEVGRLAASLAGGYEFAVIDSIQTLWDAELNGAPGSVSIVKQVGQALTRVAKESGVTLILVGHVNKEGNLAGPRHLEHVVDVVLSMEGENSQDYRIVRADKNRFGSTNQIGVFEMSETGLHDVENPTALFLQEHEGDIPGVVVCPVLHGNRPMLTEIQALAEPLPDHGGTPARRALGIDKNRLDILVAVLSQHAGMSLKLGSKNLYLQVSGGLKVPESAVDLAVCMAIASAASGRPVRKEMAFFGEVALTGELRPVGQAERRVSEAQKLGWKTVIGCRGQGTKSVKSLREALKLGLMPYPAKSERVSEEEEEPLPAASSEHA